MHTLLALPWHVLAQGRKADVQHEADEQPTACCDWLLLGRQIRLVIWKQPDHQRMLMSNTAFQLPFCF